MTEPPVEDRTVELPDGGIIGVYEYGDPSGAAVFAFHGTPSGRAGFDSTDAPAGERGLGVLAPDRPGHREVRRTALVTVADHPDRVVAMADALGSQSAVT